jgi:hypothetical protein
MYPCEAVSPLTKKAATNLPTFIFGIFFLYSIRYPGIVVTLLFVNPLNAELNPICHLLALAGAHHFVDVSRISVKVISTEKLHFELYRHISVSVAKL